MEELLITHSQNLGMATSTFIVDYETAHLDLAQALCIYNGVELISYDDKEIIVKDDGEYQSINISQDNMILKVKAISRYFDYKHMKTTIIINLKDITKFKLERKN
jgi:hypothetical protein